MNPELLRRLASRIYLLMLRVRTDAARQQLRVLAGEMEERADELEQQQVGEETS